MSCQLVPSAIDCAYLDKASILSLQTAIAEKCTFLDFVFPVADIGQRPANEPGKFAKYPRMLVGADTNNTEKVNYIDLSPENDKYERNSYTFFEVDNRERVQFVLLSGEIKFRLNLICWLKMDNITSDKRDVTDYAIAMIKNAIMGSDVGACVTDIFAERDKMKVFEKYDYSFELLRNIAFPYSCFKIVMDLQVVDQSNCINANCINPL